MPLATAIAKPITVRLMLIAKDIVWLAAIGAAEVFAANDPAEVTVVATEVLAIIVAAEELIVILAVILVAEISADKTGKKSPNDHTLDCIT